MTWVASDASGVLGAVGLGEFDIEERHDRSPWLLGMIVRADRRGSGLGRLLLSHLEQWANEQAYKEVWAANEGPAVDFYRRCGWVVHGIVQRGARPTVTVLSKRL
jgi:GNAT superfamily N-acetyltransferase